MSAAPTNDRLPVSLLTGFLGSGKTTLLNALVKHPTMKNAAVVINEFGDTGLDHLLVSHSSENTVLLDSGCLCCTVRGDLVDTLRDLFNKRVRGEVTEFDRVVIETTGLADPAPILHSLMADPLLAARYRLDGVIATVDGVLGAQELDAHPESVKQAAVADRLVLTKTDLVEADALEQLEQRLRALNPAALIFRTVRGNLDPAALFNAGLYNAETKSPDVARWLKEEAYRDQHAHACHDHEHDEHGHCLHYHHEKRHDDGISSFLLTYDHPLPWVGFAQGMQALVGLHGSDMLRMKGLMNVEGVERPVVVHGVQHLFHPPVELESWPDSNQHTRLVFITRNLGAEAVRTILDGHLTQKAA